MATNETLDALRYKSEGTDLDFKQAQYRFIKATEADKAELLKDILAMANSWRDGSGYILLGFKDRSPHPADVVGIGEHLDDANIQQFVHGKVKPKLQFHYEERMYEGKPIGVITIPKQPRPFYLANPYGSLKSNVVYVRRGSSTDEAEPPEITKMATSDSGRGSAIVELAVLDTDNEKLPETISLRFLQFEELPDYVGKRDTNSLYIPTFMNDNRHFWREAAEYLKVHLALIQVQFELTNRSAFALSNAKLEISLEAIDGESVQILASEHLPDQPEHQWNSMRAAQYNPAKMQRLEDKFEVDQGGSAPLCHVRLGTLLPGEKARAGDSLAVVPSGPGKLRIRVRVLAEELASPVEYDREIEVVGAYEMHDLDGLKTVTIS
jgi:hypothetical protein